MSLPALQMTEMFGTVSTSANPNQVQVKMIPRTYGSPVAFPANWRELLPSAVTPRATGGAHFRFELVMATSNLPSRQGGVLRVTFTIRDKGGLELGRARVAATYPTNGQTSPYGGSQWPVVVEELVGITTQAVNPSPFGFDYDWRAVYTDFPDFSNRFVISIRTPAFLSPWPYESTMTATWENNYPTATIASGTPGVYTSQRSVPNVTNQGMAPFPHVQILGSFEKDSASVTSPLVEGEIWLREFTPGADSQGWKKRGVFPVTIRNRVQNDVEYDYPVSAVRWSGGVLKTRKFAAMMLAREAYGGEHLFYTTDTNYAYSGAQVIPRPDGGLAFFSNEFAADGTGLGEYLWKSAFSSGWRVANGDFHLVVREESGAWNLIRCGRGDLLPSSPQYRTFPLIATMFNDPDILWVQSCSTPGHGAVAIALRHNLEINDAGEIFSFLATRSWLFKRSPDGINWPPDSQAVVVYEPASLDFRPPNIAYVDGTLIADNGAVRLTSNQMGAPNTWTLT